MCEAEKQKVKQLLTEVFNDIDKDKSGCLDQCELENVIKAYVEHADCPAEHKAEYGSPAKIKQFCEVCRRPPRARVLLEPTGMRRRLNVRNKRQDRQTKRMATY